MTDTKAKLLEIRVGDGKWRWDCTRCGWAWHGFETEKHAKEHIVTHANHCPQSRRTARGGYKHGYH